MGSEMFGRKVYFFGGKGGVGKTTLSSAFSTILAKRGSRVLLVSTDPAHSLSDIFGVRIGSETREIDDGLWATEIDPREEIRAYVERALETIEGSVSPDVFDQIREIFHAVEHTPGVEEAAVIDTLSRKILGGLEEFDAFVVDTAPTGHALAMLKTVGRVGRWMEEVIERKLKAEAMKEVAGVEDRSTLALEVLRERRERFSKFSKLILSEKTLFVPVLNPEKLSILETERLVREVTGMGISITHVLVNKVLPEEVSGEFMERRKSQERDHINLIKEKFRKFQLVFIRLRPMDVRSVEDLKDLAKDLEGRLWS